MEKHELAKYIDHTILSPDSTSKEIIQVCHEAIKYGFKGVCINPYSVKTTAKNLEDSEVKTISVIGFPLGNNLTSVKIFEAQKALEDGAKEIDVVTNIGAIKENEWEFLGREVEELVSLTNKHNALLKIIIETGYLSDKEKEMIGILCRDKGVDYLKTCTGFGPGQATSHDVSLLYNIGAGKTKVKASGKIKTYEQAVNLINAGASRIGASSSVQIIEND